MSVHACYIVSTKICISLKSEAFFGSEGILGGAVEGSGLVVRLRIGFRLGLGLESGFGTGL